MPDEYRLDVLLSNFSEKIKVENGIATTVFDTEHFLSTRDDLAILFKGKKTYLMENFYRKMRVKHNLLMEDDGTTPLSNRWNFDAENRKKLPKDLVIPPAKHFYRDVSDILKMLEKMGVKTIGNVEKTHFDWCISREEALALLDHFCRFQLIHKYQNE